MFRILLQLVWLGVAGWTLFSGLEYYGLPLEDRAFSSLHSLYAPSGRIGLNLGIVGTSMMVVGVVLYSLRKRVGVLSRIGKLGHWLDFHIFLCTLGPFLVLLHTSFKFGGIVSIAFWSMSLVVGSGVFGRYLYVRIPKTINGRFLGLEALRERTEELVGTAPETADVDMAAVRALLDPGPVARPRSTAHALFLAAAHDWNRRAHLRKIRGALAPLPLKRITKDRLFEIGREQLRLHQQIALLHPLQRLFRYWHVFHLPLAVLMLLILGVHVAVAVMFGYAWAG